MKSLHHTCAAVLRVLLLGGLLSQSMFAAAASPDTEIPEAILQRVVYDHLVPKNPQQAAVPSRISSHLHDAAAVLAHLDNPAAHQLRDSDWQSRSTTLRGKRHELAQLKKEVNQLVAEQIANADATNQAHWKELDAQLQARFQAIDDAISAIDNAKPGKGRKQAISQARNLIDRYMTPSAKSQQVVPSGHELPSYRQLPIGPTTEFPFKVSDANTQGEDRYALLKDILLFWVGTAEAAAPATPAEAAVCSYSAADLADDGHDVVITQDIRDLAASLQYSPIKIYQYVQANIAFEPYYGALKGAPATLATKAGGATDQASLLIALLRASNIPARYARGTVSLVDDTDLGAEGRGPTWLGTTSYLAAAQRLSTLGNPHAGVATDPNDSTKKIGIGFEHVWVESCIPYASYRGAQLDKHGHRWVPLDTSVKVNRHVTGITTNAVLDFNTYLAKRGTQLPIEAFQDVVDQAVKTLPPNYANNTLADVPHRWEAIPQPLDVLPVSLPFSVQTQTNWANTASPVASVLPDNHRYFLTLSVKNGASTPLMTDVRLRMEDIVLKRKTLSFKGVNTAAQNTIETWRRDGNMASASPCSINAYPVIKLDGIESAVGTTAVGFCSADNQLTLKVSLDELATPQINLDDIKGISAADTQAILAYGYETTDYVIAKRIKTLLNTINTTANPNTDIDSTEGEFLYLAGLKFLQRVTHDDQTLASLQGSLSDASIHLGRVVAKAKVEYLFDLPYAINRAGYLIDVLGVSANETLDGARIPANAFRLQTYNDSALESNIWQQVARLDAVSTVRGLQFARETGIEVLDLTSANWAAQSPKFTSNSNITLNYSTTDVNNIKTLYIDQGYTVKIPRSLINYTSTNSTDAWKGSVYAAEKIGTSTSTIAMMISGGYGGGWSVGFPLDFTSFNPTLDSGFASTYAALDQGFTIPAPMLSNSTTMTNGYCKYVALMGDPVNIVTGNMYYESKDITLKGQGGFPIAFERAYNSRAPKDGPLGWGWTHSFNQYLEFRDDNVNGVANEAADKDNITSSAVWVDGTGAEKQYPVIGTASGVAVGATFSLPNGVYDRLSRVSPGVYRLVQKNGMTYEFENVAGTVNTRAKLTKISDRNGNTLNLSYTSGNLSTITDGLGRQLTFAYTNNKLTRITDWAGRKNEYQYDSNGDLWKHLDPLAAAGQQNQQPEIYTYYTDADGKGLAHHMRRHQLPAGNGMTYEYYSNGRVFRHYNDLNETTTFSYNDFRRETDVTTPRGFTRKSFFNQYGSPLKVEEENGAVREYEYDPTNTMNQTKETDPLGMAKTYLYDSNGNVTQLTLPSGDTLTYGNFDSFNQAGKTKDARGNYTLFKYDAKGNVTDRLVMKSGIGAALTPATYTPVATDLVAWVKYTYDSAGNRKTEKNIRNFSTQDGPLVTYDYNDTRNNVQSLNMVGITRQGDKNGDGVIGATETDQVTLGYDNLGRVTSGVDKDWQATTTSYDPLDRVTFSTDAVGQQRGFSYDGNGNKIESFLNNPISPAERIDSWSAHFNAADRMDVQVDAGGNVTRYTHDGAGNVETITDPDGYSVSFEYDAASHVKRAYDQEGNESTRDVDVIGRIRSEADPLGHGNSYSYYGPERNGKLKTTTDATNHATTVDYDANGNVTTVTDNLGRVTTTQYDELNRPVRIVTPTVSVDGIGTRNLVTRYVYDNLGNRTRVDAGYTTDVNNSTADVVATQMTYVYDDFGRKLKETNPNGQVWQWLYDVYGNVNSLTEPGNRATGYTWYYGHLLKTVTAPDLTVTTYTRDALGRVTYLSSPAVNYRYGYDDSQRLVSLNDSRGNKTLTYGYSAGGKLNNIIDSEGNHTDYLYDALGSLTGVWAPNYDLITLVRDPAGRITQKLFLNGTNTELTYYNDNRVQSIANSVNGTMVTQHSYAYDAVGNLSARSDQVSANVQSLSYVYDALHRLQEVHKVSDNSLVESFTYDAYHNRKTHTVGSTVDYSVYDSAQQLLEMRVTNASGALNRAFVYDNFGNLTQKCGGTGLSRTSTSCAGSVKSTLGYNSLNQLTSVSKSNGLSETYQYDGLGQRIEKVSNAATGTQRFLLSGGQLLNEYGTSWTVAPTTYVHAGARPLMRAKAFGAGDYYHQDVLGSVVAVTTETGTLTGLRLFDAFGNSSTSGTMPIYGFAGGEQDATAFNHMGVRFYDSDTGRFTQPDPLGFIDSVNRYTYAMNSPLNYVDPRGTTVSVPLFGDVKKSYVSALTDVATSFVPGYDLVKAAFNPDATVKDYAIGAIGLIPALGEVGAGIKGAKALSVAEHTGETLSQASRLASTLPGEASQIAAKGADNIPTVTFSRSRAPGLAQNFDNAVANGAPTTLNRVDAATRDANRRAALRGQSPAPAGQSLDEYPFACSAQGGCGSFVRAVPSSEQNYQGGVLSRFFQNNGVKVGDPFNVRFGQ